MKTDKSPSRPHAYEKMLASVRSAAHAFLGLTDHRQHKPRSQHRQLRITTLKLMLFFNHRQYLSGSNLPPFLPTNSNTQSLLAKFLKTSQTFSAKKSNRTKNCFYPQIQLSLAPFKLM